MSHDDDLLSGLAGERTRLAWNRTALALAAAGGAILKGLPSIERPRDTAVGVLVLALAGLVWFTGSLRSRGARDGSRLRHFDEHGLRIVSMGVSVAAVIALAIALVPSR